MPHTTPAQVWVLGATGRSGGAIAAKLAERGAAVTLVGRDAARLEAAAAPLGGRTVVADSPSAMATAIRRERPAVVVNAVGPFQNTAAPIADAALDAGQYLDLANDIATVRGLLGRDADARRNGNTLVTGAGFGVTATESLAMRLTDGHPPALSVRVDMIPSIASTEGVVGEALAGSFVEGMPGMPGGGRFQGRRIADGRLTKASVGGRPTPLTTPDGDEVITAMMPLGELLAAANATKARFVESASSEAPSGRLARLIIPAMFLLHIAPLRRFAMRRIAAIKTPERPMPRAHSWAHARAEWADGTVREGWLRLPNASTVTVAVATEVAVRLLAEERRAGAYTPAALFGSTLIESCHGVYLDAEVLQ